MKIIGQGHFLGSKIVSNEAVAIQLNLESNWFEKTTGIKSRVVCDEEEDVVDLSVQAIRNACESANFNLSEHEDRTLLLHIQNGITYLTPPAAHIVSARLNCKRLKSLTFDGVCSEPINAIEIADLMMQTNHYDYIIVSAGADFLPIVDDRDVDTVGLFGAGAGAILFGQSPENISAVKSVYWESRPEHWDLGLIKLKHSKKMIDHVNASFEYYQMKGKKLAKLALTVIPKVIANAMNKAQWEMDKVDLFVTHQPNAKLLEIGIKQMKLSKDKVFCPVATIGNLGPASILSSFSLAVENNLISPGDNIVFLSFGLGFSCGAACIQY